MPLAPDRLRSLLLTDAFGAGFAAAAASGADAIVLASPGEAVHPISRQPEATQVMDRPPVRLVSVRFPDVATPGPNPDPLIEPPAETRWDGVVVSGIADPADITRLSAMLAAEEAVAGLADGALKIIAMLDKPAAFLDTAGYRSASPGRLRGLAWDAAALAAAIGADSAWSADSGLIQPLQTARSLCLMAAAAAGVPAYDTAHSTSDISMLRREAESARQHGFAGKLAVRADQVAAINSAFDSSR